MKLSNSIMTGVMLAIFVALVWTASGYPEKARFMPFVIGLPAIALCLLQLLLDARERRRVAEVADGRSDFAKAEEKVSQLVGRQVHFDVAHQEMPSGEGEDEMPEREKVRREVILWGWFLGFIAAILLFGFWISIPIFLVTFLRFQAKATWRMALGLGIAGSVCLYFAFEKALGVSPHPGFVTPQIVSMVTGSPT
jgi:hypothetical protein